MTRLGRVLSCSIGGGLGLLLATATPFAPDDMTITPGSVPNAGETGPDDLSDTPACISTPTCIDRYLWSVYERTPKIEAGGADFTWKDADAAEKAGMSRMEYVIGGMDPGFKVTLYRALRALDAAGFRPGIMCGFRDDYRQSITTGKMKAQNDRSYHGGSLHGGYGHGVAADIVSVKGGTRAAQSDATGRMWDFIDRHEKELGIGRPYLKRDPPHVAPLDGEEYAVHRLGSRAQASPKARAKLPLATPGDAGAPKRAGSAPRSKTPPKQPAQPI